MRFWKKRNNVEIEETEEYEILEIIEINEDKGEDFPEEDIPEENIEAFPAVSEDLVFEDGFDVDELETVDEPVSDTTLEVEEEPESEITPLTEEDNEKKDIFPYIMAAFGLVSIVAVVLFLSISIKNAKGKKVQPVDAEVTEETSGKTTPILVEQPGPLMGLYLEAVADEKTITATAYDEDGSVLSGHTLVFLLMKGSKEENATNIASVNGKYAGQPLDGIDAVQYEDDNKDGTVEMTDLESGTYTLLVLAEKGFATPDPVETTIEKFEIIEDIMQKVVADSEQTRKEDPLKNRPAQATEPDTVTRPSTGSTTITVNKLKEVDGNILYTATKGDEISLTETELSKYKADSILVVENGENKKIDGYVYSNGTVEVTDGTKAVVKEFLVVKEKSDKPSAPTEGGKTEEATTTAQQTTATSNEPTTVAGGTENQTETKKYFDIYNVNPIIETEEVYGDGWQSIGGKTYYFEGGMALTGWNKIGSFQYYFNEDGSLGSSLMVDVSQYNGDINWSAVKAAGIDYAIIRVGYRGYEYARLVKDKKFETNMQQAIAAGVKVSAYIVTQAVNTSEAVEEASFIIEACRPYNISLPLVIDVESAGGGAGRGDKISAAERTAVINAFAQTVMNSGYSACVYANKNWLENFINVSNITSGCSVWLAQYRNGFTYGGNFQMWQFTDSGNIDGFSGNVDVSALLR